jgi:D-alanine-D-alanine ligase
MSSEFSKIAVLAGGPSCEREISLISGKAVYDSLQQQGFTVLWVDAVGDFMRTLKEESVDLAFIALHGAFGEDGSVQKLLEKEGIAYTGPGVAMSERAFDKSKAQILFDQKGVRVPKFTILRSLPSPTAAPVCGLPCFVKPAQAGSSVGVSFVKQADEYYPALKKAFEYSDVVIVDEYVRGRELTVGILGDKALPIVEVVPKREFYDYEAKYGESGTEYIFPAKLTTQEAGLVSDMAIRAYQALGGEVMSRVDLILSQKGEPFVLEINTIPGLTPKSLLPKAAKACGLNFDQLCARIIDLSIAVRERV